MLWLLGYTITIDTNMEQGLQAIFDFCGSAICHQMAERSFFPSGVQNPVCARCTGIEAGVVFGILFLWLAGRKNGNRPFSLGQILLAAFSFVPMAVDGVGSYLGFWESNNFLRVVTGAMAGYGIPALFLLVANFMPTQNNDLPIYRNWKEQIFLMLATIGYGILVWLNILPYWLVASLSVVGVICVYGCFWYLFLRLLTQKRKFPCMPAAILGGMGTVVMVGSLILILRTHYMA